MRLENYEEFIEYALDQFEIEDDITVICDYNLADVLNYYFGDKEYCDYKGIDLQSDIDEYYVTKFGRDFFCITPIKNEGKIKTTTGDYFIIDNNILEENPTLFNHLEGDDFKVEIIDYDEDEMDLDEIFGGNSIEGEIDEDDDLAFALTNLIAEYTELILDNDCKEEIIGHALTEFGFKVLEKFYSEK